MIFTNNCFYHKGWSFLLNVQVPTGENVLMMKIVVWYYYLIHTLPKSPLVQD